MTSIVLAQNGLRSLPRKSISNSTDWWERPKLLGSSPFQKAHRLWKRKTLADVTLNYETGGTFFKLKVCVGWFRILKRIELKKIHHYFIMFQRLPAGRLNWEKNLAVSTFEHDLTFYSSTSRFRLNKHIFPSLKLLASQLSTKS